MATFPNDRHTVKQQSAQIFTDIACRTKAAIFKTNGQPYPESILPLGDDGLWPLFTCNATIVYYKNATGQVASMAPNISSSGSIAITGAKATGAAVASLIAGLQQLGIPITDSTT